MMISTLLQELGRDWKMQLVLAGILGLTLGVLGPFGSYLNGPLWQGVAHHTLCALAGVLVLGSLAKIVLALRLRPRAMWCSLVASGAVGAIPLSWLSAKSAGFFWPSLTSMQPLDWYVQMLVIAQPVTAAFALWLQRRQGDADAGRERARTDSIVPGLLGVRPEDVVCLQMEDHYVRVHTRERSRLVLATFRQAMEAVANRDGLRVHRSWWAARDALASVTWQGRNLKLILVTGIAVPVARSSIADLRAAGWLSSATLAGTT